MTRLILGLLTSVLVASAAFAQGSGDADWPTKPVRLIAPFPPASTADVIARVLGQKLSAKLGQQFVVDNRVGASGNIGADAIAKAAPDGYTIGVVTASTHAVAVSTERQPALRSDQGFHADHDDRELSLCAGGLSGRRGQVRPAS